MKKLIPIIILLLFTAPAWGATYYVDADAADDTGTGEIGDPWKTVAKVEATATTNDTVYFQRGDTWAEKLDPPAANMTFSAYGTGALPIIDGTTQSVEVVAAASGTTLEYLDITGASNQGIRNYADDLTVRYCNIHGNTNYGIITYATSSNVDVTGVRITENNIYENGENTAYGNVFFSAQNGYQITSPQVDNNTIYNSSDDAATGEKGIAFLNSGATTGLITGGSIHDNDISNIEGRAIELAVDVTGVDVYNNDCEDTYICVHLGGAGADSNDSATSNNVYSNTSNGDGDCSGTDCVAFFFDDYAESNNMYFNRSENHSIGLKFNNDDGSNSAYLNEFLSCGDYGVIFKDAKDTDSALNNTFIVTGGSGTGIFFSDSTASPILTNNIVLSTNTDTCGWDEGTPLTAAPVNTYNLTYGFGTAFCEGAAGTGALAVDPRLTSAYVPMNKTVANGGTIGSWLGSDCGLTRYGSGPPIGAKEGKEEDFIPRIGPPFRPVIGWDYYVAVLPDEFFLLANGTDSLLLVNTTDKLILN